MFKTELELIIKRLDCQLGFNKEQIIKWMNGYDSMGGQWNGTPYSYVELGLYYLVVQRIDYLELHRAPALPPGSKLIGRP